ncbi:MAG: hypothetical protein F4X77_15535, partial [Acidobacteriia bacterium]|nr:hypothetical protein [Terriglobia bacterium]
MIQPTYQTRSSSRAAEIRRLNALTPAQVSEHACSHLHVVDGIDELHLDMAQGIASELRRSEDSGRHLALILPWGPVGQYPILGELLKLQGLSLRNCTLFFMDEYADSTGCAVPSHHPLSFRGAALQWI